MGCTPSRNQQKTSENDDNSNSVESENSDNYDSDQKIMNIYDEEYINDIRKDLNERPEIFVLNNVLMATFFIENYKKEISECVQNRLDISKEFMEPDSIIEKANKNLIYRPLQGPKVDKGDAFITKRIYVPANDSIEVVQNFEDEKNCDKAKFKVKVEESHRKGYAKIREVNRSTVPIDDISQIDFLSIPTASSNGSSDTDTFSDTISAASSINDLRIPKPVIGTGISENYSLNNCFVYRKIKKLDVDIDLEDMDTENLTDEDVYDIVSYLSAAHFMKHFQTEIFQNSLEKIIERDNMIIGSVGWLPGKILCNFEDINENNCPYEIVPCLKISWPEAQTFNFLNQKTIWPTEEMLQEIKCLDCALVQKGFHKRNIGVVVPKDSELEWEIHFPLAERYLDTFLTSSQMKCFLVLLAIHKEYIEPFTKYDGLLTDHIRHHIYWDCSEGYNYTDWPEHRLGFKLVSLIRSLSEALSRRKLNDYFVQKKNMLKNIPRKYLEPSNEIFHLVSDRPLIFIIRALRNLRHKSGKFYPPLDFKELIQILQAKEIIDPINTDQIKVEPDTESRKPKPPMFKDAEKQLQYVKMLERKKRKLEELQRKMDAKNRKNLRNKFYSIDVQINEADDIDDEWICEKHFDVQKKDALLKLFIQQFIDIAKVSSRIDTNRRTLFYLKQAYYLTRILDDECVASNEELNYFYKVIREEESKCLKEEIQIVRMEPRSSEHSLNLNEKSSKRFEKKRPNEQSTANKIRKNSKTNDKKHTERNENNDKVISEKIVVEERVDSSNGKVRKFSYSRVTVVKNPNIDRG